MSKIKLSLILAFCCLLVSNISARIIDAPAVIQNDNSTLRYETLMKLHNFATSLANINAKEIENVNENCLKQWELYTSGIFTYDWALKMFDATSKPQAGFLEGQLYSLGSFDECLSIRNEIGFLDSGKETVLVNGKYCLGVIYIPGLEQLLSLLWAICIPAACSATDLNTILANTSLPLATDETLCQVYEETVDLDGGDIAVIIFLAIIGAIAILSTAYDIYLIHNEKTKESIHKTLTSFSIWTNGTKLFSIAQSSSDQLECLSGLRTISMMWIVYSHNLSSITATPLANLSYLSEFFQDGWTMYVRGATVSVDTFLLMSGIVLIYVYLKSTKEDQVWFNVFHYYLHRYIRLTPALAVLILVHVTIVRYFGAGPLRPFFDESTTGFCQENWWTNMLYIQNFVNMDEMCLGQTWYLAVDMQLFLLSPLILIPIRRWRKATLAMIVVACCASLTSSFLMAWIFELRDAGPINETTADPDNKYMQYNYVATYNRASPYLIGILVGYFIHHVKFVKKSFTMRPIVNLLLWVCCLAVMFTCVFYDNGLDDYDKAAMSAHVTFIRPAWAIATSWIIFSCVTGYGGPVNSFLSLPIFQVLARLTYSLYLVHITIIILIYASAKTLMVVSNPTLMYNFWSLYIVCVGVAIAWTLLFESPIIMLEKSLKTPPKK